MYRLTYLLLIFGFLSCSTEVVQQAAVLDNPYYDSAYVYLDKGQGDRAFFAFDRAKNIFLAAKDSLNTANCLINMAITQKDQGDYYGAQETALQADGYLNPQNPRHQVFLSTNYNNLGAATVKLNDYDRAIGFYKFALQFSNDPAHRITITNNIALIYQKLKLYDQALAIYSTIQDSAKAFPTEYARVLSNQAKTKWLQNRHYNAKPEFLKALAIRKQEKDLWGENASYSQLADFYNDHNSDSAAYYAKQMYHIAMRNNSPTDRIEALDRLINFSPPQHSRSYFQAYKLLSDSVQQARAAAKNQFALIRYELEKNKSDNLRLQKENAEHANHLFRQRMLTGSVSVVFFLAIAGGILWYKKRKERLELEASNRLKALQLNLSKKIHDVVANGIYRVMSEIEHKEDLDREGILDKLESMYLQSRDISHDVEEQTSTPLSYNEQLADMLKSFANNNRRILIAGNDAELWIGVNKRVQEEIRHVLQELMVNMKKHSAATQVLLRFEREQNLLEIVYKDNGKGLAQENKSGLGKTNTVSRIESLGGKINFANEPGNGLRVTTKIPLS